MKSAISEMKKSKNKDVYLKMWGDWIIPDGDFKIGKTVAEGNGEGSNVSYSFIIEGDQKNGLADVFGVQNKELFGIKYDEAISGSGKEQKKITTLHSSSLCSLLIFYNVSEENPLLLKLDGKIVKFTKSVFEYKNVVISNPSNIDVVLLGTCEKAGGKRVILFLESKFSEYYCNTALKHCISKAYLDTGIISGRIYNDERMESDLGLKLDTVSDDNNFSLCSDTRQYLHGIKQMISHYVGVVNFSKRNFYINQRTEAQKAVGEYYDSNTSLYLGTIVFDDKIGELDDCYVNYAKRYHSLAEIFNSCRPDNIPLTVLPEVLNYSLFKNNNYTLEAKIKEFYFGQQ